MTNSDLLRDVHNSFHRAEMFHMDDTVSSAQDADGEAPHHFIAYSLIHGHLYELDGLQPAPVDHGSCSDYGVQLQKVLQARMARYAADEVHFNLLALTRDPLAGDGAGLSVDERIYEEERREMRRREIEMRRHNFASAVVETIRLALRNKTPEEVDALICKGQQRTKDRRERQRKR